MSVKSGVPLSSRPLDLLYFLFFAIHLPATLLLDLQALYPRHILPSQIAQLPQLYIGLTHDPLVAGAMGYVGGTDDYLWFKSFMVLEALFQLPVFIVGMLGLSKNSRAIYPLLLIYGASTTTTFIPCLAIFYNTPLTSSETIAKKIISITAAEKQLLFLSYVPFFVIVVLMTVDMAFRISKLIKVAVAAEKANKSQ